MDTAMLDACGPVQCDGETRQGDIAFEMLRADIVACRIVPGSSVSEAELADRYKLGKAGIRRALVRLSERDWVQALPRRGYLVKPITLRDIGEIFGLRRMIEPAAVRVAAGRVDVNRLRQLDAICGAGFVAGEAASQATFMQAHRQLHLAVVTAGGNLRLADVFEPLWDETERVIYHTGLMSSRAADLRHDHTALIAALAMGHGDAAASAAGDEIEQLHHVIVDMALKTASMLAPAPRPAGSPASDAVDTVPKRRTARRGGRAIEQ
jgi:DNA-binding GntR family transcriptional regulator